MALVGVALVLGFLGALATGSVMASLLYDVSPRDPLTFAVVTLSLGLVALLACWIPARSASAVDPQTTLRSE
jgi:ABC-type lipoprotein release transport system permease subunit